MKSDIKYLFIRISIVLFSICLLAFFAAMVLQKNAELDRVIVGQSKQLSLIGNAFTTYLAPDSVSAAGPEKVEGYIKDFRLKLKLASYYQFKVLQIEGTHTRIIYDEENPKNNGKDFDFWKEMQDARQTNRQTFHLVKDGGRLVYSLIQPLQIENELTDRLVLIQCDLKPFLKNDLRAILPHGLGLISIWFILELLLFLLLKPVDSALSYFRESFKRLQEGKSVLKPETGYKYFHTEYDLLKEASRKFIKIEEVQLDRSEEQKQIKEFLNIVTAAAEGDFTVQANVTADALGALSDSFNLMISDLSKLIKDVKNAAFQVAGSTADILANIEEMAQGAEDQARQTENISRLAHEMNEIFVNTRESAQKSAKAAQEARLVAQKGEAVVQKAIEGMHNIRRSVREAMKQVRFLDENSARIGEISDFIAEISSRTNLLALNASIEAARAGESGRGFSIVAEEIRNLAESTNTSAEEISKLIEAIQKSISLTLENIENGNSEVAVGVQLVDQTGDALREILEKVEISSNAASDISQATEEQTRYSQQIARALEEIAGIAKTTADRAQQSRQAAQQLEALSKELNKAVEKFKLSNNGATQ
ncbi:methyl-accepting chemotaxis protein [Calditrichota bacterium GD2]